MNRISIFRVDENGLLHIDKEEIREFPEFKAILERAIPTKGDYDGRKKVENKKIFIYIKIVADLFSYPNQAGSSAKDVHLAAIREAQLDPTFKPDKEIVACIEKYREMQIAMLPALNTISTVLRALKLSDKICHGIIDNIEAKMELQEKKRIEAEGRGETLNIADEQLVVDGYIKQLKEVTKISSDIPDTVTTLEKLDVKLKNQSMGDTMGRGGKAIGARAEPKR